MSWTRLDDSWCDAPALEALDFATRWHYLCMIQFCCRNDRRTGVIRAVDARRCSDHPDPARALADLDRAGLIEVADGGAYRLINIGDHVPPDWVVKKAERDKIAKRRQRAHKAGDHSMCIYGSGCGYAPKPEGHDDSRDDSHDEYRDGTGRDGTGMYTGGSQEASDWNVIEIPRGEIA